MLQNIADQLHHMFASGTHVPGVACCSTWRISSIQSFTVAGRSKRWTLGKCSSCSPTVTLEARCSSTVWKTASPTGQEHVCPCSWRRPSMRYLEYERAYWFPVFSAIFQGKKHNYFIRLTKNNDIVCRLFRCWLRDSGFLAHLYRIMWTQMDRLFAFARTSLLKEQLQHIWLPARRDRIVSIRSGCRNLVIVYVHSEPDLTLRRLRDWWLTDASWPYTVVGSGGGAGYVGQTYADSSSPLILIDAGKYGSTVHSPFPRRSGNPTNRPELPSRGMASHGLCGAAQWPWAPRKTRTTTPLDTTLGAAQSQQTKVRNRWGCKRPFAFFTEQGDHSPHTGAAYLFDVNTMLTFTVCFKAISNWPDDLLFASCHKVKNLPSSKQSPLTRIERGRERWLERLRRWTRCWRQSKPGGRGKGAKVLGSALLHD